MDQLLQLAGPWLIGLVMGTVCTKIIPSLWNKLMITLRSGIRAKAKEYLKDPEIKAWVAQGVLLAQKKASKDENINKLKLAGQWLKAKIPGELDDQIINCMIELMIAEVKKPIDIKDF